MNVGFIGLGKLGLPCAVAAAQHGHTVWGNDPGMHIVELERTGRVTHSDEPGIQEAYDAVKDSIHFAVVGEVVRSCELLLVSVQTPQAPGVEDAIYKGEPSDFDYSHLIRACRDLAAVMKEQDAVAPLHRTVVIVSTVLPTTTRKQILHRMERAFRRNGDGWTLVYSPSFIAQSTVVRDYQAPEFSLLGTEHAEGAPTYERYLRTIHNAPILHMTWESAELAKCLYNTALGLKIMVANTAAHLAHTIEHCDPRDVMGAISLAKHRITSPAYFRPGMGDGGPCHQKDALAMAHLCASRNLRYNPFDFMLRARDEYSRFLAWKAQMMRAGRPVLILGVAFKPDTTQVVASPSMLLARHLKELGIPLLYWDPLVPGMDSPIPDTPVFAISAHPGIHNTVTLPEGSEVLDPWYGWAP